MRNELILSFTNKQPPVNLFFAFEILMRHYSLFKRSGRINLSFFLITEKVISFHASQPKIVKSPLKQA